MRKILSMGQYVMEGEVLGKGNFGRVELATHRLTRIKVAIKIIDTRKLTTRYQSRNLYREAKILSQTRHPNIVRMYETLKASYFYCLVLEYVPNKDLEAHLKTLPENRMEELEAWPVIRQLCSAVLYLHQQGIVHRDLKMPNILLDEKNKKIKIVDFGLSNCFLPGELLKTHCGSPEYAAPELFQDKHDYGPEVDTWSFGVIMYGIVVGNLPFVPGSTEPSKRHALRKMLNKGLVECHIEQMYHLTIDCRSLILQLIEPKPELRMPMHEVAYHPWITRASKFPLEIHSASLPEKAIRLKVISKVSHINKIDPEVVEDTVGDYKFDALSAQYNMLLDRYITLRQDQITIIPSTGSAVIKPPISSPRKQQSRKYIPPHTMTAILSNPIKDDTPLACPERVRSNTLKYSNGGTEMKRTDEINGKAEECSTPRLFDVDMRYTAAIKCLQFQTPIIKITHESPVKQNPSNFPPERSLLTPSYTSPIKNTSSNIHQAKANNLDSNPLQVTKLTPAFHHQVSLDTRDSPDIAVKSSSMANGSNKNGHETITKAVVHLDVNTPSSVDMSCSTQDSFSHEHLPSSGDSDVFEPAGSEGHSVELSSRIVSDEPCPSSRPTHLPLLESTPEVLVSHWLECQDGQSNNSAVTNTTYRKSAVHQTQPHQQDRESISLIVHGQGGSSGRDKECLLPASSRGDTTSQVVYVNQSQRQPVAGVTKETNTDRRISILPFHVYDNSGSKSNANLLNNKRNSNA